MLPYEMLLYGLVYEVPKDLTDDDGCDWGKIEKRDLFHPEAISNRCGRGKKDR